MDERWILVAHVAYTGRPLDSGLLGHSKECCDSFSGGVAGFLYAHFCHGVIRDICRTRNIYCLRSSSHICGLLLPLLLYLCSVCWGGMCRLGKRRENLVEIKNS